MEGGRQRERETDVREIYPLDGSYMHPDLARDPPAAEPEAFWSTG